MKYIIYKITNLINGKFYIGKHKCKKLDDSYFGSGFALKSAIKLYGKENFVFHLEFELHNQEEMDLLERYVVNKEFVESKNNYNVSLGGPNCILFGENNGFYGKHHTEETKKKISEMFKGTKMPENLKEQIRQTLKQKYIDYPELRDAQKFTEGKVVVNKDSKNYFMKENEIPYNEGYVRGSHTKKIKGPKVLLSKEEKLKIWKKKNEINKNRKWYNNGKEERWLLPEEVTDGYVLGRLKGINVGRKFTEGTKLKMRLKKIGINAHNKGQIFITNGIENKYINSNLPIPKGWKRGMTRNKNKGK